MKRLPKVIATSVIRSVQQGESHGGIYLVDLQTDEVRLAVDWNNAEINWEGRGLDRGLRGVAIHENHVYIAASDEIFIYSRDFKIVKSFKNSYLKHCHEIHISNTLLFLTSTGFDSILIFDLIREEFVRGYCVRRPPPLWALEFRIFDPMRPDGPAPGDTVHINNVFQMNEKIGLCGTGLQNLLYIAGNRLLVGEPVPKGTHNACPYGNGILVNDTEADRLAYFDKNGHLIKSIPVIKYKESDLLMADIPRDHARQGFARGLCIAENDQVIGGTSPSTISLYNLETTNIIKSINLTMDIRNSIHGLEVWPFPIS